MAPSKKPARSYDHMATAAFRRALGSGDKAAFVRALERGADPNAKGVKTPFGRDSLLQSAAEAADPVAVEVLLKAGARRTAGRFGVTPLLAAAQGLVEAPTQARLRVYELLLSTPAAVFAQGGEVSKKCALEVLLSEPSPLVEEAIGKTLRVLRGRSWPAEGAANALELAVQKHPLLMFSNLIDAGAPVAAHQNRPTGLGGHLYLRFLEASRQGEVPADEKEAWWDFMAPLNPPVGFSSRGQPNDWDAAALEEMAKARARRLDHTLAASSGGRRGPRL